MGDRKRNDLFYVIVFMSNVFPYIQIFIHIKIHLVKRKGGQGKRNDYLVFMTFKPNNFFK